MKNKTNWPSILQLTLSFLAALTCWGFAFLFALGGLMDLSGSGSASNQTVSYFLLAAGAGISGILLLPSAGYALLDLVGGTHPWVEQIEKFSRRYLRPTLLIFLMPLVVWAGILVVNRPGVAWFILPILHVLAVGLPVLWLGYLGWRGLSCGSNQRAWGIFGTGLILGPGLILIFEIMAAAAVFVIGMIYVGLNPALVRELQSLALRFQFSGQDPEKILPLLMPYLAQPLVMFTILAYTAGIVPLIEEAFKPIGVWLLVGTQITPGQGFTAGLLSGAGYALFENLALTTSAGGSWGEVVVTRIGTGLLHILTAGLSGWALALAWKEGRYLRLGFTYLLAVLMHGTWNGLALLAGISNFTPAGAAKGMDFVQVSRVATIGLGSLALVMFVILLASNAHLRAAAERSRLITAPPAEPGDGALEVPIAKEMSDLLPDHKIVISHSDLSHSQEQPTNQGEL
jgi:hypothetical protein